MSPEATRNDKNAMANEMKFIIGIIVATVVLIIGAAVFMSSPTQQGKVAGVQGQKIDEALLVTQDSWKVGSQSAKLTLVEFSDFECPACGAAYPTVKQIKEDFKDQIRFVYRHFPLPIHQRAVPAAIAAEAAGRQGKFWEMHDTIFENQKSLTNQDLEKYARDVKLDIDQFKKDLENPDIKKKIENDKNTGVTIGVNATPTFYINGQKLQGGYVNLRETIEAELKK